MEKELQYKKALQSEPTLSRLDRAKSFIIEIPLTINTYDIDIAGHVNNIVYIRWLEDLRIKLFSSICDFKDVYEKGYYPIVISTFIKYKKQIKLFDSPIGKMKFDNLKHGIITLNAQIGVGKQIHATAEQKCVIMELKTSRIINNESIMRLLNYY